jgi:acyl-CoA thioesterase FadM
VLLAHNFFFKLYDQNLSSNYKALIHLGDKIEIALFSPTKSKHTTTKNIDFHCIGEGKTLSQMEQTQMFLNYSGKKTMAPKELSKALNS